jgi:hypothetical protein
VMEFVHILDLVPAPRTLRCTSCHVAALELQCERCGAACCDACYWSRIATETERRAFVASDDPQHRVICTACRS